MITDPALPPPGPASLAGHAGPHTDYPGLDDRRDEHSWVIAVQADMLPSGRAALTTERDIAGSNPGAGSPRRAEEIGPQDATGAVHMPGIQPQPGQDPRRLRSAG